MTSLKLCAATTCVLLLASINCSALDVSLGAWLEEDVDNLSSVTGTGDTFTATPGGSPVATDPFAARQKVYQLFDQPIDFSDSGQTVNITFDVVMNGMPGRNDTDFRMSLVDTSTNQGFYALSWDLAERAGTYSRSRFVDNLDGPGGGDDGFAPWGGSFIDAINGSGTIAGTGAAPTVMNDAEVLGLVEGNTVHFDIWMQRDGGNQFQFSTLVEEANGDVLYPDVSGDYNPVTPSSGDMDVRGEAINQWDGIVFGIFDNNPFPVVGDYNMDSTVDAADYTVWRDYLGAEGPLPNDPNGEGVIDIDQYNTWRDQYGTSISNPSYTVSNITIEATALVPMAIGTGTNVPEPTSLLLAMFGGVSIALGTRRRLFVFD